MNTKDAARVRELQHDPRGVLDLRLAPRILGIGDRVCADAHDDVAASDAGAIGRPIALHRDHKRPLAVWRRGGRHVEQRAGDMSCRLQRRRDRLH